MSWYKRLDRAFENAPVLPLNEASRYVLFSDCHRGCGNANDNFLKNRNLYYAALRHYYESDFTYIELGDGDELWENHSYRRIIEIHREVFLLLDAYQKSGRLYLLYGNHDHCKKYDRYCNRHCRTCLPEYSCCSPALKSSFRTQEMPLFTNLKFRQGLILSNSAGKTEIFLTHGHQPDFLNSTLAPLSGFLVRFLWKPLEHLGVHDPTSAARNYTRKHKTERRLTEWAKKENKILITGHTHRPMTGTPDSPYFNTGSCVHPESIACIEITGHTLSLVKWVFKTRTDMTLYVAREVLKETALW